MKKNWQTTAGLSLVSLGLAVITTAGVKAVAKPLLGQVLGDSTQLAQATPTGTSFLPSGSTGGASVLSPLFQVNIPAVFTDATTLASLIVEEGSVFNGQARFVDEVILEGGLTLTGNVTSDGTDIDVGSGEITASNLVYSVLAGSGITVSGDQDITVTNADRGSAQKIFGKVKVGSDTAEAGSNTDTFEFSAGDGIGLSLNTSDKKLTLTASNLSGWYKASSSNVALITSTNNVGIGTSSPSNKLEVDSGTDGESGVSFTRVTSSTSAGIGGGKVLSVDSGGRIILVQDQTGDNATPSAEAVLPTATSGMTLYFNGTNWAASNNLFHDGGSVGISTTSPAARFQVNTNLASKIGAIIQGYTSQTANLQEWRDSSGSILSYIDASGVFNGSANVSGALNPGLTNGSVLFQGASGITQDNSNFFWDDTNNRLGLGTSSPSTMFNVEGGETTLHSSLQGTALTINANGTASTLINAKDYYSAPVFQVKTDGSIQIGGGITASTTFTKIRSQSGGTYVLQLQNYAGSALSAFLANGTVGIGTTAPTALLHINGGYGANDAFTVNQTLGGNILSASASGVTKLVLTNGGNLGIGTTTPGARLHVASNGADWFSGIFGGSGGTSLVYLGNYSAIPTIAGITSSGNTTNLSLNPVGGNVGIGTTSPASLLSLQSPSGATGDTGGIVIDSESNNTQGRMYLGSGASFPDAQREFTLGVNSSVLSSLYYGGGYKLGTVNDSPLIFLHNNIERMRIDDAFGNVGIGTSAPTAGLHIQGGIGSNDALTVNQTLGGNILSASASGVTKMVLSNGGNLGIGTTIPGAMLEVNGNVLLPNATAYQAKNSSGTAVSLLYLSGSNNTVINSASSQAIAFTPGGSSKGYFNATGLYLGGAVTPTNLLDVAGGVAIGSYAGVDTAPSNGLIVSGNVGIGTTNPTVALDVSNTSNALRLRAGNEDSVAGRNQILLSYNTSANYTHAIKSRHNGSGQVGNAIDFYVWKQGTDAVGTTGTQHVMTLDGNGNVGIGTTNPAYKLEVVADSNAAIRASVKNTNTGSSARTGVLLVGESSNNYAGLEHFSSTFTAGVGTEALAANGVSLFSGTSDTNGLSIIANATSSPIKFFTGGLATANERMRIDGSGNMGIGTTNPTEKLTVIGNQILRSTSAAGQVGTSTLNFYPTSDMGLSAYIQAESALGPTTSTAYSAGFKFVTSNSSNTQVNAMIIQAQGNVGIGTTSPTALLHVNGGYGSNDALTINQTLGGNILSASASGTTRMVLKNTGFLGLGTTTPSEALDVVGGIAARGAADGCDGAGCVTMSYESTYGRIQSWGGSHLALNSAGNYVGIGTTAPVGKVDLYAAAGGTADNSALYLRDADVAGISGLSFFGNQATTYLSFTENDVGSGGGAINGMSDSASVTGLQFRSYFGVTDPTDTVPAILASVGKSNGAGGVTSLAAAETVFQINNLSTNLLTMLGSGYVGIGTTTPTASLHVETADNTTARFSRGTNAALNISNFANHAILTGVAYDNGAYKSLQFETVSGGTMYLDTAGNVGIGTTAFGTSAAKVLALVGSTAPSTSITDGVQLFAVDVTGSHELQVRDEAGNVTTISPHNFSQINEGRSEDLAWSFYSERNGLAINADMTKALRVVEKLSGEKLVYIKNLTNGADLSELYAEEAQTSLAVAQFVTQSELSPLVSWTNDTWTFVSRVVFEKPAEFLAEVTFKARVNFTDADTAGLVVMKAHSTVAHVTFDQAFATKPAITITPQNTFVRATVSDLTTTGFTVTLESAQDQDIEIIWTTISVSNLKRSESEPLTPPTVTTAPTPTGSAAPDQNPAASPLPTPSPTPSPEVAGAATPAATESADQTPQ